VSGVSDATALPNQQLGVSIRYLYLFNSQKTLLNRYELVMRREQEILNVEQLAVLLAVPKSTVYTLVRDGQIPGHKVGRHWRFSRAAVLRWMEESSPHVDESGRVVRSQGECRADR